MSDLPPEPSEVIHLDVDDALEIFGAIIRGTARQAADHLRDGAGLPGALARPINYAQYENADWINAFSAGASPSELAVTVRQRLTRVV